MRCMCRWFIKDVLPGAPGKAVGKLHREGGKDKQRSDFRWGLRLGCSPWELQREHQNQSMSQLEANGTGFQTETTQLLVKGAQRIETVRHSRLSICGWGIPTGQGQSSEESKACVKKQNTQSLGDWHTAMLYGPNWISAEHQLYLLFLVTLHILFYILKKILMTGLSSVILTKKSGTKNRQKNQKHGTTSMVKIFCSIT